MSFQLIYTKISALDFGIFGINSMPWSCRVRKSIPQAFHLLERQNIRTYVDHTQTDNRRF